MGSEEVYWWLTVSHHSFNDNISVLFLLNLSYCGAEGNYEHTENEWVADTWCERDKK